MSTIIQWILVHPYKIWKKCIFNIEINISTVLTIQMSSGKSFHALKVSVYLFGHDTHKCQMYPTCENEESTVIGL